MKVNLFIVGAARSGTTYLSDCLKQCPHMSVSQIKEPNYFTVDNFKRSGPGDLDFLPLVNDLELLDRDYYTALVPCGKIYHSLYSQGARVWCDASPSYMYYKGVAKAIFDYNPSAKIIILLRDPIARLRSAYGMNVQWGREYLPLATALACAEERMESGWEFCWDYEGASLYAQAVEEYLNVFGKENVAILDSSELFKDLRGAMACLHAWFDLDITCLSAVGAKANARSYKSGELMLQLNRNYSRASYARRYWPKLLWKAFRGIDYYAFSWSTSLHEIPDSVHQRLLIDCDKLQELVGGSFSKKWSEVYG